MFEKDLLNSIQNPDNQLAFDAQSGDEQAEEALIRKYTGMVINKAKAYFMAGADKNDVIQEGLIGLLRAVRRFDPEKDASFAAFAEVCVTNQIISAIRSADRIKHQPLNDSISLSGPVTLSGDAATSPNKTLGDTIKADNIDAPETILIMKDVTAYILHNGDKIFSDFEMQVLTEFMKGYSIDQIADRLGKSYKSIDNAIQRAKKKVIAYLWK